MFEQWKPLLATQVDELGSLKYPGYTSKKYDGIRACVFGGVAYSRTKKPIANKHIQQWVQENAELLQGVDGEFIAGSPTAPDVFRQSTSVVMSQDKQGDFYFYAFDIVSGQPYEQRYRELQERVQEAQNTRLRLVEQELVATPCQLELKRSEALQQGYEGLMYRSTNGRYKYGRSSIKEGILLKLKLFSDAEFKVIGYDCMLTNTNKAETNELGYTERSTAKAGMQPTELLGVLLLRTPEGKEFGCGSGFTMQLRKELWEERAALIGRYAKVKYFEQGDYDVPRFPVFLGFRHKDDI